MFIPKARSPKQTSIHSFQEISACSIQYIFIVLFIHSILQLKATYRRSTATFLVTLMSTPFPVTVILAGHGRSCGWLGFGANCWKLPRSCPLKHSVCLEGSIPCMSQVDMVLSFNVNQRIETYKIHGHAGMPLATSCFLFHSIFHRNCPENIRK